MIITTFTILLILLVSYEFFRTRKNFTILFFTLFPVLCTPLWIVDDSIGWFKWIKVYSLVISIIAITMSRYGNPKNNKALFNFIYLILGINILEALVKDAYTFNLVSVINIFIGIFLILSLMDSDHNIHISHSPEKDFVTPKLNFSWIFIYSLWNWVFIYSEYTEFALKHIAVLSAPIIINYFRKGSWLQVRAITLGFYVITSITTNSYTARWFPVIEYNEIFALFLVSINIIFLLHYSLVMKNASSKKWHKKLFGKLPFSVTMPTSLFKK